jgi:hypothetical protein
VLEREGVSRICARARCSARRSTGPTAGRDLLADLLARAEAGSGRRAGRYRFPAPRTVNGKPVSPVPRRSRGGHGTNPASAGTGGNMKITDVEAIWLRLPTVDERCDGTQDTLVVRVHTDAGVVGVGEVDSSPSVAKAIIEAPLSHAIARGLRLCVLDRDPLDIAPLWDAMYRGTIFFGRGGAAQQAISGVDMALWDIAGKVRGEPVCRLLGGAFHTRLRAYASILFEDTPAATHDTARRLADQGFTAVKFGWGPLGKDEATDRELVRQAGGGWATTAT